VLTTITKAGAVLDLFSAERPEWGVTETAAALGIPKASAHDVLSTLVEIGLVRRTRGNRYRLGWRVLALSRVLVESVDFRAYARSRMRNLAGRYGGTLHLAVLDGPSVVYLEKATGADGDTVGATGVGLRMDAHCSAVGKVLLAAMDARERRLLVDEAGMPRRTARTITDPAELDRALDETRARGYARDDEEGLAGVCCVAAPIYDDHHEVQAALSVSVAPDRFRRDGEGLRRIVQTAAADVSRALAGRSSYPDTAGARSGPDLASLAPWQNQ
jgi:DNA-binding IclR family transcriptional regulator